MRSWRSLTQAGSQDCFSWGAGALRACCSSQPRSHLQKKERDGWE